MTKLPSAPPALYASGSGVAIFREYAGGGTANLTDAGLGFEEARQIGAEAEYQRQAERLADDFGLVIRHGEVIAEDVDWDRIDGAAQWIAHVSTTALSLAMYLTDADHNTNEKG